MKKKYTVAHSIPDVTSRRNKKVRSVRGTICGVFRYLKKIFQDPASINSHSSTDVFLSTLSDTSTKTSGPLSTSTTTPSTTTPSTPTTRATTAASISLTSSFFSASSSSTTQAPASRSASTSGISFSNTSVNHISISPPPLSSSPTLTYSFVSLSSAYILSSAPSLVSSSINSLNIDVSSFFTLNNTSSQLNGVLTTYTGDLSGCLANCSNQGMCVLNTFQHCKCDKYKTGKACQFDVRSCSSNPCLNNGTCSHSMNIIKTSFQCMCQNNLYFGTYCVRIK